MKKIISIIMVLALCLSLCACGEKTVDPVSPTASPELTATDDTADAPSETPAPTKNKTPENLKSEKYVNIIKSGKFYMEATISGAKGTSTMKMAKNGGQMGMSAVLPDGTQAGLVSKDGKNHIIDHANKIIMVTSAEVAASASNMPAETLDTEGLTYVKSGTGSFLGKNLPYDEYRSASGAVTRFYLNGDKLAGMEAVSDDRTDVYEITTLSQSIPAELFNLPADYQVFDLSTQE